MSRLSKDSDTFPLKLGQAAKDVGLFTGGFVLGVGFGFLPIIGVIAGMPAIGGFLQRHIKNRNEGRKDYERRIEEQRKTEAFLVGGATGIIVGMLGQIYLMSS